MYCEAGDAAKTRNTGRRSQKGNLNEIQGKRDIFLFNLIYFVFIIGDGGMEWGGGQTARSRFSKMWKASVTI